MPDAEEPGLREGLWGRPEGHILIAGLGLIFMYMLWLGLHWMRSAAYFQKILSLMVTRFITGRPGGVYFGHVLEFDYGTNIGVNVFMDVAVVLLFYPLFVLGIEKIFIFRSSRNLIERIHKTAQTNYKIIKTYGVAGLFLFVLFPLWGTGPVVGCAIGFMMGLRPWFNMGVVLSATLLAVVLWVVILAGLHVKLMAYNAYMPAVVIGVFFVIAIGAYLTRRLH